MAFYMPTFFRPKMPIYLLLSTCYGIFGGVFTGNFGLNQREVRVKWKIGISGGIVF